MAWGGDMSPDPSVLKMEEAEHALALSPGLVVLALKC